MRLREFHQTVWGLDRITFSIHPLSEQDLPLIFAERDNELDRAVTTVFDTSRNVLIYGLFGIGKSVFIEAMFSDLKQTHSDRVLCVSESLDSADSDVKTTILRGLARELSHEDDEAKHIHQLLSGVELTTQQMNKATGSGEAGITGLFKVGGGVEDTVTETWARKLVPNAAYQIRNLIQRTMARRPDRRLIVAIDDLDKRDPATVRANLADARPMLHENCSFVFTGHPLGILRQAYDSVGGVFDLQLELKMLPNASMRLLMERYLEAGRRPDARNRGIFPFTEEAAEAIINRALGIPRVLNVICLNVLQEAGELRSPQIDLPVLRECWQRAGEKLRRAIRADLRYVYEVFRENRQGLDPEKASDEMFDNLGVESYASLIAKLNAATREDLLVGVEQSGKSVFLPQPLLQPLTDVPENSNEE